MSAVASKLASPSIVMVDITKSRTNIVTAFTRILPSPKVKRRIGPKAKRTMGFKTILMRLRAPAVMAKPSIVCDTKTPGTEILAIYKATPLASNIKEKLRMIPIEFIINPKENSYP
ncbi:MAG: hypothetical protein WD883_00800 [Candidatus Colwellbacteria bacterium]